MTKARSTTTDGSPVPTPDGRSNDGKILPEFGAGRTACLRAEVPPTLRQHAVVYHRLYDRVFGDQCSASATLLSRFIPRRSRPGQHQRKPLSRRVVLWCDSGMDKTCSKEVVSVEHAKGLLSLFFPSPRPLPLCYRSLLPLLLLLCLAKRRSLLPGSRPLHNLLPS